MSLPLETALRTLPPGQALGLAGLTSSEPGAAAPLLPPAQPGLGAMPVDPSATLLLSSLTAPNLNGTVQQPDQQPPPPQQQQPAALGTGTIAFKQEPAGPSFSGAPGPIVAPGRWALAAPSDAVAYGDVKPPLEPNGPEAVAAALSGRIASVGASVIFEKPLTASDVSGGGRVVVPKSVAEQYFPKLEQPSGVTISATDLDGRAYTFKWRFWVNNSSRMYLLEGAGELHRNYGLEVGDVMVFAQKPDGSLVVAGRVASKSDLIKKPPVKRLAAAAAANISSSGSALQGPRSRDVRIAAAPPPPRPKSVSCGADAAPVPPPAGAAPPGKPAAGGSAAAAAAGAPDGGGGRGRKRKVLGQAASAGDARGGFRGGGGEEGASLAVLEMEAPSDGIFRAVVMQHAAPMPLGVALARNNRWTATLHVAGELYQAFFDTRDDAVEAVTAAGASP